MEQRVRRFRTVGLLVVAVAGLATAMQVEGSQPAGPRCRAGAAPAGAAVAPLEASVRVAIAEALEDERRTEAQYARFLREFGEISPFSRTVRAEARHAEFLEELLKSRSLPVPAAEDSARTEAAANLKDACATSIVAEKQNVAIYDRLLAAGPLPDDVKRVFEHNRWASQEHHLPAFERCAGAAGHAAGRGACGRGRGPGGGRGCCGGGRDTGAATTNGSAK